MIQVRIKGVKNVIRLSTGLPSSMELEVPKGMVGFAKAVQKSAKLRAPRDTGFLASQIKVRKLSPKTIMVDTGEAYYAYYQEFGFRPHIIPSDYIRQHYMSPSIPGRMISSPTRFIRVSKSTPFMFPALYANIPRLGEIIMKSVKNAVNKSRKGG